MIEEHKKEILDFLKNRETQSLSIPMIPINNIKNFLGELGYDTQTSSDDTNGWQVDFWYYFNKPGEEELCLSGSLWYGKFNLSKDKG